MSCEYVFCFCHNHSLRPHSRQQYVLYLLHGPIVSKVEGSIPKRHIPWFGNTREAGRETLRMRDIQHPEAQGRVGCKTQVASINNNSCYTRLLLQDMEGEISRKYSPGVQRLACHAGKGVECSAALVGDVKNKTQTLRWLRGEGVKNKTRHHASLSRPISQHSPASA